MNESVEFASFITVVAFTVLVIEIMACGIAAVWFNTLRNIKRFIVAITSLGLVFGIAAIVSRLTLQPQFTSSGAVVVRANFPRFIPFEESAFIVAGCAVIVAAATTVGVLGAPRD